MEVGSDDFLRREEMGYLGAGVKGLGNVVGFMDHVRSPLGFL